MYLFIGIVRFKKYCINAYTNSLDYRDGDSPVLKFTVNPPSDNNPNKIERWWPNGYGEQKLYDLEVTFESTFPMETRSIKRKVAFR